MDGLYDAQHDLPAGDPRWIEYAVAAVAAWHPAPGTDVARLLATWRYAEMLTGDQVAIVVAHFAEHAMCRRCGAVVYADAPQPCAMCRPQEFPTTSGTGDPGPVPEVVEPDGPATTAVTPGRLTVIATGEETSVTVGPVPGGHDVFLTVRYAGTAVTVALVPDHVEVLVDALAEACSWPDLPLPGITVTRPLEKVDPQWDAAAEVVTAERARGGRDWTEHPSVLAEVMLRLAYLRGVWQAAGLDPGAAFPSDLFEPLLNTYLRDVEGDQQ